MQQVKVSSTLTVEVAAGAEPGLRIIRDGGGLVLVRLEEVRALVAALSELAGRAAAEAGDIYVDTESEVRMYTGETGPLCPVCLNPLETDECVICGYKAHD